MLYPKTIVINFWIETLNVYQCAKFQSATPSEVSIRGATFTCCRNLRNRFQCECATGYEGAMCEIDRDECASNPCLNQGVCRDLPNGFECRCITGFTGNKFQNIIIHLRLKDVLWNHWRIQGRARGTRLPSRSHFFHFPAVFRKKSAKQ